MVRIPGFKCHSLVSIPDQGTEIPQATWHSQKKKKYKKVKNKLEVITEKSTGEKELKVKTDSFPSFFFFPLQNMFRIFQFRRSVLRPL